MRELELGVVQSIDRLLPARCVEFDVGANIGYLMTLDPCEVNCGYRLDGRVVTATQALHVTTFDRYLDEHPVPRLDLVKCDTDGMEAHVFRGGVEMLCWFRPAVILELGPGRLRQYGSSPDELLAIFRSVGYRLHREGTLEPLGDLFALLERLDRGGGGVADVVALAEGGA